VMIRESLAPNAAHVILDLRRTGDIEFMTRRATGAATTWISGAARPAPAWLKLTLAGTTVTGAVSADGASWQTVGNTTLSTAATAIGLAVTSHDAGTLTTATCDNVDVSAGLPQPWTHQDVGSTGQPGSASYAGGTFTVRGAGADVWGTSDAFQFVSQPLGGDGQIVARLASLTNTQVFAK